MAVNAEDVRVLKEQTGWSQRQVAEYLGLTRSAVQRALDPEGSKRAYKKNREKRLRSTAVWRENHPEYKAVRAERERTKRAADPSYAQHQRSVNRAWRAKNLSRAMWVNARKSARVRGLEFSLSVEDIHIPTTCPVYSTPLDLSGGARSDNTPSLDRVDNSKGYVPHNVRVISWAANRDKRALSVDKLLALAEYVINHQTGSK